MNTTCYLLLRLAIGFSLFGHGLVRLPKIKTFGAWMVSTFSKSMLPRILVSPFSYALPFIEFIVGILCITGLQTRTALIAGSVEMTVLILGSCLIENWEPIVSQLLHVVVFVVLLQFIDSNTWALDNFFNIIP